MGIGRRWRRCSPISFPHSRFHPFRSQNHKCLNLLARHRLAPCNRQLSRRPFAPKVHRNFTNHARLLLYAGTHVQHSKRRSCLPSLSPRPEAQGLPAGKMGRHRLRRHAGRWPHLHRHPPWIGPLRCPLSASVLPFFLLGITLMIGALGFEFVNGFHDTANAVATCIYTHSRSKPAYRRSLLRRHEPAHRRA